MLNKSIFFSKVPKYLYHKDKTPYFTNPKEMTLVQSQYELFSYGVLIGTIFSFIGLAAFLSYKSSFDLTILKKVSKIAIKLTTKLKKLNFHPIFSKVIHQLKKY